MIPISPAVFSEIARDFRIAGVTLSAYDPAADTDGVAARAAIHLCWLGFAAPSSYGTALFSGKPKQLWLIDSTYNLVSFVLAGAILAVWR